MAIWPFFTGFALYSPQTILQTEANCIFFSHGGTDATSATSDATSATSDATSATSKTRLSLCLKCLCVREKTIICPRSWYKRSAIFAKRRAIFAQSKIRCRQFVGNTGTIRIVAGQSFILQIYCKRRQIVFFTRRR